MPRPLLLASLTTIALALPAPAQQPTDAQHLAAACNRFAADLHGKLGPDASPTCSPGSIAIALLMLLPGAKGDTAAELAAALRLPDDLRGERLLRAARDLLLDVGLMQNGSPDRNRPPSPLVITNDLWVQHGAVISPAYATALRESFGAGLWSVDFRQDTEAARNRINAHIAKATRDRIRDLLQPGVVLPDTRVVLTNALWFKAAWANDFWHPNTKDAPFTLADGSVVDVPTMDQANHFSYAEADGWQCVSLPFDQSTIQCEFVLPREGASLAAAERALLTGATTAALRGHQVRVRLPRFQVAAAHNLKAVLQALGVRAAFDPGRADFSGITTEEPLVVDEVVHRTWIQVDEKGAEAAAATAAVLKVGSAMPSGEPKLFQADRPFSFVLRDRKTGLILFVGRVTDPRAQQG